MRSPEKVFALLTEMLEDAHATRREIDEGIKGLEAAAAYLRRLHPGIAATPTGTANTYNTEQSARMLGRSPWPQRLIKAFGSDSALTIPEIRRRVLAQEPDIPNIDTLHQILWSYARKGYLQKPASGQYSIGAMPGVNQTAATPEPLQSSEAGFNSKPGEWQRLIAKTLRNQKEPMRPADILTEMVRQKLVPNNATFRQRGYPAIRSAVKHGLLKQGRDGLYTLATNPPAPKPPGRRPQKHQQQRQRQPFRDWTQIFTETFNGYNQLSRSAIANALEAKGIIQHENRDLHNLDNSLARFSKKGGLLKKLPSGAYALRSTAANTAAE